MNRQKGELPVEQTHGQSVLSEEPLQIIQPDHDASWAQFPVEQLPQILAGHRVPHHQRRLPQPNRLC
jgi:hypothetical protein